MVRGGQNKTKHVITHPKQGRAQKKRCEGKRRVHHTLHEGWRTKKTEGEHQKIWWHKQLDIQHTTPNITNFCGNVTGSRTFIASQPPAITGAKFRTIYETYRQRIRKNKERHTSSDSPPQARGKRGGKNTSRKKQSITKSPRWRHKRRQWREESY